MSADTLALGPAAEVLAVCDDVDADAAVYRRAGLSSDAARLLAWAAPDTYGDVQLGRAAAALVTPGARPQDAAQAMQTALAEAHREHGRARDYRQRLGVKHKAGDGEPDAPSSDPRALVDALVEAGHGSRAEVKALPLREALEINARAALDADRQRERMERATKKRP